MKYNDNGEWKDIAFKTADTLPIGTSVDYEGENVPEGWEEDTSTDWVFSELDSSKFKAYQDIEGLTPKYRKIGKLIEIKGVISPVSAITANTKTLIFTLPEGYRPSETYIYSIQQGSDMNRWLLSVASNGDVTIDRYGTTTASQIPVNAWLPFQTIYTTD